MDDESSFSNVVSATNDHIGRLTRNVALTASTLISGGGAEHSMAAPSAYHKAMTEVVTYRRRMLASKIKDASPQQAIRQSLVRRIGGVRAPELPEELLANLPKPRTAHSLFQTFEATVPSVTRPDRAPGAGLAIRKEMAASELLEIDERIAELRNMRKLVFDRMAVAEREQSCDEPTLQHYYPSGERIKHIDSPGPSHPVVAIDFNSPFGQLALTRGDTLEIHDLNRDTTDVVTLETLGDPEGRRAPGCLAIHGPDSLCVAGVGDTINVWRPQQSLTPAVLTGHIGPVVAVDYDGDSVVSASLDATVRAWDHRVGRNTATIDMFEFGACHALQHAGTALATGSEDGILRLWDLRAATNRPQRQLLGGHVSSVSALHFSGLEMVSGACDGSVRVWDLRTGQVAHAEAYPGSVTSLNFDSTKVVASVAGERAVRVFFRTTGEHRLSAMDAAAITAAKYMKGYLVTGRDDGSVGIWAV